MTNLFRKYTLRYGDLVAGEDGRLTMEVACPEFGRLYTITRPTEHARWEVVYNDCRLGDAAEDILLGRTKSQHAAMSKAQAHWRRNKPQAAQAVQPTKTTAREYKASAGEVLPDCFGRLMALASCGQNTLMVGPSGSGKTFLAAKIAEKLERKFGAQSCSAGMSEAQLAGWLLPVGESGKFDYVSQRVCGLL